VDTAAVLAAALTDYVLAIGVGRAAPAAGAPEHMAAWLEAHGYHVVHRRRTAHGDRGGRHGGPCPPGRGLPSVRAPDGGAG
jgi:Protein of unknown function (DUF3040)